MSLKMTLSKLPKDKSVKYNRLELLRNREMSRIEVTPVVKVSE